MKNIALTCALLLSVTATCVARVPRPVYGGMGQTMRPFSSSDPMPGPSFVDTDRTLPHERDAQQSMPSSGGLFDDDDEDELAREEVINQGAPTVDDLESSEMEMMTDYFYRIVKDLFRIEHGWKWRLGTKSHERARVIVDRWEDLPVAVRAGMKRVIDEWRAFQEVKEKGFPYDPAVDTVQRPNFDLVEEMTPSGTHLLQGLFRKAGVVRVRGRYDKDVRTADFFARLWGKADWNQLQPLSRILSSVIELDTTLLKHLRDNINEGENRQALSDLKSGHDNWGFTGMLIR